MKISLVLITRDSDDNQVVFAYHENKTIAAVVTLTCPTDEDQEIKITVPSVAVGGAGLSHVSQAGILMGASLLIDASFSGADEVTEIEV